MKLTHQEAKKVVELYYSSGNSPSLTARRFNTWSQENNSETRVSKKNVMDTIKRFSRDTPFNRIVRVRPSLMRNENTVFDVLGELYQRPGVSIRTCAEVNRISTTTTHRIAQNVLKLRPYRQVLVHALSAYDKMVRVEACHRLLEVLTDDKIVVYSDEAVFRLDGLVNRWNYRVWDHQRPDDFIVQQWQGAPHVIIWAAMTRDQLFGPYIFPSTVTGDTYRAILSEYFVPDLLARYGTIEHIWFQQDGAPAHCATATKHFLIQHFQERLVSRECNHEWPPRSPDLTPCDFYLWGGVRDIVYRNGHFNSLPELENALIEAFNLLRLHKMADVHNAVCSVRTRLQECINLDGSQLIHR